MPFAEALSHYSAESISTDKLWPDGYVNQKVSVPRIKENLQKISKKVAKVKALSSEAGEVMRKLVAAASRGDNCNALELQYNKLVAKIAAEKDYQVWISRVSERGGVGIVIENGEVK